MPIPSEKGVGQDSKQTSGPWQFRKNDGLFSVLLSQVGTAQHTFNLSHRAHLAYIVIFSTQAFHAKNESDNLITSGKRDSRIHSANPTPCTMRTGQIVESEFNSFTASGTLQPVTASNPDFDYGDFRAWSSHKRGHSKQHH